MLWVLILATDLVGLAAGAWLLWGGRARGGSWGADALRWAGLGLVLGVLTLLAGIGVGPGRLRLWVGGGGFLVLRLWCHVIFCVLVPLAVARGAQRRGAIGLSVVVLGLGAEGAYVWARRVEPYRLEVTRHEVRSERLRRPLRVAVLADLQTDAIGAFEERVFAELDAMGADLLLVPGDLLQHGFGARASAARERAELVALFAGLRNPPSLGMLMVGGDCEPRGVGLPEAGVRLLEDEAVAFPAERLQVIGLTRPSSRRPIEERFLAMARDFDGLTIVLGHRPEFALSASGAGVPLLCVAGHTHGGQVQLPLVGPLVTLSVIPRRMAGGGLFPLGDSWLCLSRGIGMERGYAPRIRFLCRPELVVLELAPAATASPSAGTTRAASAPAPGRAGTAR